MKKNKCLVFLLGLSMFFASFSASAQDDIANLFRSDIDESTQLIEAYISPFMKSSSLALNQGWYNTAKPHKFFGLDITTSVSLMRIPDSEAVFNVSNMGLEHFSLLNGTEAPTIFGTDATPTFQYDPSDPDLPTVQFEGPPGLNLKEEVGINAMPMPMAHLGISLPKGTDLKVRFVPAIDLDGEGEFKMFGVGVMHDIKQHIPGVKLLPFDLSAFFGYTQLTMDYNIDIQEIAGENRRGEMKMTAMTLQGVISKKLSILTVYAGAGYNLANSKLAFKGKYDLDDDGDFSDPIETDPIAMDFKASGFRATAGFRIKLAILTLHADYTFQKYNAITAGVGLSIR